MSATHGARAWLGRAALAAALTHAPSSLAQTGAPPADTKPLAAAPKAPTDAPAIGANADDGTTVTVSAGGMLATGNSRTLALTGAGAIDSRIGRDGFGASLLGNYGQGAAPGNAIVATTQNVQGRLRYDRYVIDRASLFLLFTTRHDRFQGLDVRFNVDPGVKYLFVKTKGTSLWGELGYDFQYDVRRDDARRVLDDQGAPVLDAAGQLVLLDKTRSDHSTRLFAGYRHAFRSDVTFSTGIEYLQSVVDSSRWRANFEALLAAKIAGGFAVGFGMTARYDHEPLPRKEQLDTTTNLNLIYAFSDVAPADTKCPCPAPAPPPPCEPPALPPPPPEEGATSTPTPIANR